MRALGSLVLVLAVTAVYGAEASDRRAKAGLGKLSYALHRVAAAAEAGRPLPMRGMAFVHGSTGRVSAVLELAKGATVDDVRAAVTAAGGEIKAAAEGRVTVLVPARMLRTLASEPKVERVREPHYPSETRKIA